jgi:hypothetical protein
MHPRRVPKAPSPTLFVHVAMTRIPDVWHQYLAHAA